MKDVKYQVFRVDRDGEKHLNGTFTMVERAQACVDNVRAYWGKGTKVEVEPPLPVEEKPAPVKKPRNAKKAKQEEVTA